MAYNADIPQASDDPSQSQGQILGNFQELNTSNSVNHGTYSDADQGKHKFLQMPEQSSAPTTAANEAGLYTKEVPTLAVTGLYFRDESDGTERQLTNLSITNLVNAGTAAGTLYRMDNPLRFTIYSGVTNAFSGSATVTFPAGYTTIFGYSAVANDASVQKISAQGSTAGITLHTENSVQISWYAIGQI